MTYAILTHGGAGSPRGYADGCWAAAERAREVLEGGGSALDAAIQATVALEDDPRFNAGTGSNLRLDGRTVQMDASAMTSDARFGGVGCIERVKNPILVAAKVMETPHLLLVGDGATAFARRLGFPEYDPSTPAARRRFEAAEGALHANQERDALVVSTAWTRGAVERFWNFAGEPGPRADGPTGGRACDTVGAVVRDAQGRFAATASTGGTRYMLRGRVGDSPLLGAGVYAGPAGAVAATGVGEEILRRLVAKTTYDQLAAGVPAVAAAQAAIDGFAPGVDIGVIVLGMTEGAVASNRDMATANICSAEA